ncbi:MAG: electron transfer flavoprotein subunit beta/FixA family protein [Candidatus Nezhaarchaeota archaeon]|nr:electron transfer flavoprotein subunit beta/FixA family protein [Candidatus Nezhaarchaeota archaeon]
MPKACVCVKYSLDVGEIRVDPSTRRPITVGVKRKVSDFDKNAIEEAVRLKERHGWRATAITYGPDEAKSALREALAMGVDEAVLVTDPGYDQSDSLVTSLFLAEAIKKEGPFDLILLGEVSIDDYAYQVGPRIAGLLGLPQITHARRLEVKGGEVVAERDLEEGYEGVVAKMPAVVTVTKEINEPRYPKLMDIMKASKKPIKVLTAKDLGIPEARRGAAGAGVEVLRVLAPEMKRKGQIVKGKEPSEAAAELVELLAKEGVIR